MERHIAIERVVTPAKTIASYIRLRGRWLREHGFEPGNRVAVRRLGEGVLELRAVETKYPRRGIDPVTQGVVLNESAKTV